MLKSGWPWGKALVHGLSSTSSVAQDFLPSTDTGVRGLNISALPGEDLPYMDNSTRVRAWLVLCLRSSTIVFENISSVYRGNIAFEAYRRG